MVTTPTPGDPVGIKGIGEIGVVGAAAAIANAVWHATGVRHRNLPIRPDRVLLAGTERTGMLDIADELLRWAEEELELRRRHRRVRRRQRPARPRRRPRGRQRRQRPSARSPPWKAPCTTRAFRRSRTAGRCWNGSATATRTPLPAGPTRGGLIEGLVTPVRRGGA